MIRSTIACAIALLVLCGCTGDFPKDASKLKAAEEAYNEALLVDSLNEIEAWHARNDTGVANILTKGRPPTSILEEFSGTDCKPTAELKALWSWHDGGVGATPFVWYHDFLPLKEALSEYKWLRLNPLVQWDPQYIPIFAFEGEWYAAYCGQDADSAGPIVHYFLEDEPRMVYVNLTAFMASMAEALRSGAVQWDNDAMTDDIREMRAIHQRFNRGYDFPYYVPEDNQSLFEPGAPARGSSGDAGERRSTQT